MRFFMLLISLLVAACSMAPENPMAAAGVAVQPAPLPDAEMIASVRSGSLLRRKRADGQKYDPYALTAGHPSFPLNTCIRITTPAGKSAVLLVNDRPKAKGQEALELTPASARLLGLPDKGPSRVKVHPAECTSGQ